MHIDGPECSIYFPYCYVPGGCGEREIVRKCVCYEDLEQVGNAEKSGGNFFLKHEINISQKVNLTI